MECENTPKSDHDDLPTYDIAVIGGGLHGVAMAAESASRGLRTLLIQSKDLASGTTTPVENTGLNIRRLEQFKLGQVASNLEEVAKIASKAPHTIKSTFASIIDHHETRSFTRVSAGVALYKRWLNKHTILQSPPPINCSVSVSGLIKENKFSDCFFDPHINANRLTIAVAQSAREFGADIQTYHELVSADRQEHHWTLKVKDQTINRIKRYQATILINCCGWGAEKLIDSTLKATSRCKTIQSCAAYVFVKKSFPQQQTLVLQQKNKELLFISPFDDEHICIHPIVTPNHSLVEEEQAVHYLLNEVNQYLNSKITRDDIAFIKWKRLATLDVHGKQSTEIDQAYLDLNNPGGLAPALSIFGTNLLQHRKIAYQGMNILEVFTNAKENKSYVDQALPGGRLNGHTIKEYITILKQQYAQLPDELLTRLAHNYGSEAKNILRDTQTIDGLGKHFGHQLYQREIEYLVHNEWATTAADILWRRTFLGLHLSQEQSDNISRFLNTPPLSQTA